MNTVARTLSCVHRIWRSATEWLHRQHAHGHGTPTPPPGSTQPSGTATPPSSERPANTLAPGRAGPPIPNRTGGPVRVNATLVDPVLASSVTVLTELRRLPGPSAGQESIALKLTIRQGTKYTSGISTEALKITAADGESGLPMLGGPNYTALLIQHGLTPVLADDP